MKSDGRVRYTKMMIRHSLLKLLESKTINKVTVTDICTLSEINRATFYYHYRDAFDLLNQIQEEMYEEIRQASLSRDKEDRYSTGYAVLSIVSRHADLFRILLSEKGDKSFLEKIGELNREQCLSEWQQLYPRASKQELKAVFAYISHGSLAIIESWLKDGMKTGVRELAEFLHEMNDRSLSLLADHP